MLTMRREESAMYGIGRLLPALALAWFLIGSAHAEPGVVNVRDVGAVGDGRALETKALQAAIDRVAAVGGGTVVLPAGTYRSGTLQLKSHVELHLNQGAVLLGSDNLADYQLDGHRVGLLFTQDASDVAITGPGTIDGQGDHFMD